MTPRSRWKYPSKWYLRKTYTNRSLWLEWSDHKSGNACYLQQWNAQNLIWPLVGVGLADTLILDIWPPELWKIKFLLFQTTQFVVICYGSPMQLTHVGTCAIKSQKPEGIFHDGLLCLYTWKESGNFQTPTRFVTWDCMKLYEIV